MLESECKMFLDSMELQEVLEKLNTEISVVPNDGEIFLRKILGLDA
jgi:hypothetical protein